MSSTQHKNIKSSTGAARGRQRLRQFNGPCHLACGGFSLIEIMVAVSLLLVIMLGLLAMFTQTQNAFRASMAEKDVLESGRAAADLISRELEQVAPAYTRATNFYAQIQATPGTWLVQPLPGTGKVLRTNILEGVFYLMRQNQTWYGVSYQVVPLVAGGGVGTLYRYVGTGSVNLDPAFLFGVYSYPLTNAGVSRFVDGVVHFKVRAFDLNGALISPVAVPPNIPTNALASWLPAAGEVGTYVFTSNAVPAYVELEVGILETSALQRYKSLPGVAAQRTYLQRNAGSVHLFRRRVPIHDVDPAAYPSFTYP